MADHRDQAEPGVGHVDVAVPALRRAVDAAHVVGEDPPRLDAARDVHAHVAVKRRADVVRPHRGRDADRGRLVAAARVERAGDLSLPVEDVAALLDAAREEHVAVDPEQVLAVEAPLPHLLERAARLGLSAIAMPRDSLRLSVRERGNGVDWLREERRRTLGDWAAFCLRCGHALRCSRSSRRASCRLPDLRRRVVSRCPSCDAVRPRPSRSTARSAARGCASPRAFGVRIRAPTRREAVVTSALSSSELRPLRGAGDPGRAGRDSRQAVGRGSSSRTTRAGTELAVGRYASSLAVDRVLGPYGRDSVRVSQARTFRAPFESRRGGG